MSCARTLVTWRTAASEAGGSGTRPGSNGPGATGSAAGNSGGTRPGMPRLSVMTQSVWPQNASVPSSSRASVRRRAQTLRKPVMAVETDRVVPSVTGTRIPSLGRAHDPREAACAVPVAIEAQLLRVDPCHVLGVPEQRGGPHDAVGPALVKPDPVRGGRPVAQVRRDAHAGFRPASRSRPSSAMSSIPSSATGPFSRTSRTSHERRASNTTRPVSKRLASAATPRVARRRAGAARRP